MVEVILDHSLYFNEILYGDSRYKTMQP